MSIYISSTYKDLKLHREAVLKALRCLGSDYIAMEEYTASDERPVNKCLNDVADSRIYVGIFAWRYGYIPDEFDRSITELEYRKAEECGIPRYIFLIDRKHNWQPDQIDHGDDRKKVLKLRSELEKVRQRDTFTTPDNLALKVVTALIPIIHPSKKDIINLLEEELKTPIKSAQIETISGDTYNIQTNQPSIMAQELAKHIPDEAEPYELALKAFAESETEEAREILINAEVEQAPELEKIAKIYETRAIIEYYAGNYAASVEYYKKTMLLKPDDLGIQNRLVVALEGSSNYTEGVKLGKDVLAKREADPDTDPTDIVASLNNLATLYKDKGKYAEAERLFRRSIKVIDKFFGNENLEQASTLNNLAELYRTQCKYAKAEPLYKKSISIRQKYFGKDHHWLATTLNNLALLYHNQGWYTAAEPLYKRSIEIQEKSLGKDHPSLATTLNNLAELYRFQGMFTEAKLLNKKAVEIKEKSLGNNHPSLAKTLDSLANVYQDQGKLDKAEPLYKKAAEIIEKSLGKDHPELATTLNNLGFLYTAKDMYNEAELLYKRALDIQEKSFGNNHPSLAIILNNLGGLYQIRFKYAKAKLLFDRSFEIIKNSLGENHPELAATLNNLASLYKAQGRYSEAEPLYKRSIAILEKKLPDHPNLATGYKNYAIMLDKINRHDEAKQMRAKAEALRARHRDVNKGE